MGVFGMKNWTKTAGLYALVCAAALLSAMALSRVGSAVAVFSGKPGLLSLWMPGTVERTAGHCRAPACGKAASIWRSRCA